MPLRRQLQPSYTGHSDQWFSLAIRGECDTSAQTYRRKRANSCWGQEVQQDTQMETWGMPCEDTQKKIWEEALLGTWQEPLLEGGPPCWRRYISEGLQPWATHARTQTPQGTITMYNYGWPTLGQGHSEGLQPLEEVVPEQTKQARKEVQESKKEGATGRRHQVLTPASCIACRLTEGPGPNLWCKRGEWRWGRGEERFLDWSWAWGMGKKGLFPKC